MHKEYSPYSMVTEANRLISEATTSGNFPLSCEKQIISLLNTAESYPNMSTYQLSLAHKSLADLYCSIGVTGSAMKHYEIALQMNSKIAVKKKIKQLKSLPIESLSYSLDANIASEPDYSNISSHKIELDTEFIERNQGQREKQATYLGMSVDEYNKKFTKAITELQVQAKEDNRIYDPEWEKEIEERLSKLGEQSKNEFYRIRRTQNDDILSLKELDRLTLEAMERSFHYQHNK